MVWVHKSPVRIVPITPITIPAFEIALGIARIPVPRELFTMWISAPKKLKFLIYQKILK